MRSNASFNEAVFVAANSLRTSKLRSFLTLLGIILATATLIAVMSVIHGMDVYIAQNVSDMGADGFRIERFPMMGNFDPKKWMEMNKRNPQLREDEYQFLKEKATLCREFGIQTARRTSATYEKLTIDEVRLQGVSSNMAVISNTKVEVGRFISDIEDRRRMPVVFIGSDLRDQFFPNTDPVGKIIQLQGRPFQVVGVAKAQGSVFGNSRDQFAMIPIQTYFKMFGNRSGMSYAGMALDRAHLYQAQDELRVLLRSVRQLRPNEDDNFGIFSSDTLVASFDQATAAVSATAVAVVSVFMIVGGVVIMNIMMAVVTERTHEIGIRKSVGARRQDILSQFLVESAMLAGSGGLIGTLLAWGIAVLVRNTTPVPMDVPMSAVVIGVALSTAVGLFFGIYPARSAAMMDPIEALRVEK